MFSGLLFSYGEAVSNILEIHMAKPTTPTTGFLHNSQFPEQLRRPIVSVAPNGDRTVTAPTGQKAVVPAAKLTAQ